MSRSEDDPSFRPVVFLSRSELYDAVLQEDSEKVRKLLESNPDFDEGCFELSGRLDLDVGAVCFEVLTFRKVDEGLFSALAAFRLSHPSLFEEILRRRSDALSFFSASEFNDLLLKVIEESGRGPWSTALSLSRTLQTKSSGPFPRDELERFPALTAFLSLVNENFDFFNCGAPYKLPPKDWFRFPLHVLEDYRERLEPFLESLQFPLASLRPSKKGQKSRVI